MTVPDRLREQVRNTHRSMIDMLENEELGAFIAPDQREILVRGAQELYVLRAQLAVAAGEKAEVPT